MGKIDTTTLVTHLFLSVIQDVCENIFIPANINQSPYLMTTKHWQYNKEKNEQTFGKFHVKDFLSYNELVRKLYG